MSKRKAIKTSIEEIVDYWSGNQDKCNLSVDWAEAHERCWRCGCKKHLQRCHIIPGSIGGKDEPSNLVLLCKRCHADGPNVEDPEIMWDWIKAYGIPLYDRFWTIVGRKEYEFIYGRSIEDELKKIFEHSIKEKDEESLFELTKEKFSYAMGRTGIHFGQPYFNTATVAGVYRMMLKDIAKALEVDFPIEDENRTPKQPWWFNSI